jgi:hypothetical protein
VMGIFKIITVFCVAGIICMVPGDICIADIDTAGMSVEKLSGDEAPLLKLEADVIEYDPVRGTGQARGNALITYAGNRLAADSILLAPLSGMITALGNVTLFKDDRIIHGSKVEYDIKADRAIIEDGRGSAEDIYFSGKKVEASRRLISILEGTFTTCSLPNPHYRLTAKRIEYYSNGDIFLRSIDIWIGHYRVFHLPQYRWHLHDKYTKALPSVSYDSYYGWHLSTAYTQPLDEFTSASADLKIGNKIGGRLNIQREEPVYNLEFSMEHNRTVPDHPDCRVSYAPNLSIYTKEFALLKHKAGLGMEYGSIHEMPTDIQSYRAGMQFQARSGDLIGGDGESAEYRLNTRKHWYGTDDTYSSIGITLDYGKKLDKRTDFALSYGWNKIWGNTPFISDRLSAPHRFEGSVNRDIGSAWNIGLKIIYDLSVGDVWDSEFSVGRYLHCMEIRAVWRQRSESLGLEINLLRK